MSKAYPAIEATLARATHEVAAGQLWRAKEILAGSISSQGYSPERFAAYGRILAQMQDTKEAGKYLFLSGLADETEAPVVETFLASMRNRPPSWIYAQFPGTARRVEFGAFPERVRAGLNELGFPPKFGWGCSSPTPIASATGQTSAAVIGSSILGLIILGLVHGCYVVGSWIFGK